MSIFTGNNAGDGWMRIPGLEVTRKRKDVLIVKIIFGHLLPEILQPGTGVNPFPNGLYIVDLALKGRADECG